MIKRFISEIIQGAKLFDAESHILITNHRLQLVYISTPFSQLLSLEAKDSIKSWKDAPFAVAMNQLYLISKQSQLENLEFAYLGEFSMGQPGVAYGKMSVLIDPRTRLLVGYMIRLRKLNTVYKIDMLPNAKFNLIKESICHKLQTIIKLTKIEEEILFFISHGLSQTEMATILEQLYRNSINLNTLKYHYNRLLQKFKENDILQIIAKLPELHHKRFFPKSLMTNSSFVLRKY